MKKPSLYHDIVLSSLENLKDDIFKIKRQFSVNEQKYSIENIQGDDMFYAFRENQMLNSLSPGIRRDIRLLDKTMYVRILSVHQVNAPIIRIGDIFFDVTSTLEPEVSAHFSLSSSGNLTCEVNNMPIFSAMRKTSKFGILKRLLDIAAHTMVLASSYEVNFYLPSDTEPKGILKQKFSLMNRRYELDMSLDRLKAIDRRLAIAAALILECD